MTTAECPTCGQTTVNASGPGQGACTACNSRFFAYPEILPGLARFGVNTAMLRELLTTQSSATIPDPSMAAPLRTIFVKGMKLHVSPQGQAIWVNANDAPKLVPSAAPGFGAAVAAPGPPTAAPAAPAFGGPAPSFGGPAPSFGGPAPADDPMAALGLGAPSPADPMAALGLGSEPAGRPAGDAELGLELGPRAERTSTLDADTRALFEEELPPPPPPSMHNAGPVKSESAFGVKPSRFSGTGAFLGKLMKLGILAAIGAGGWFGYQEVMVQFVWPSVAMEWGYEVGMPQKPPPVRDSRDTERGTFETLEWTGEDGLTFLALWMDVGFGQDEVSRKAVTEVFGPQFEIEPRARAEEGWKTIGFKSSPGGDHAVGAGRIYLDADGHVVILGAYGPTRRVADQSSAEKFYKGLVRRTSDAAPGAP